VRAAVHVREVAPAGIDVLVRSIMAVVVVNGE